ncbi:MAG TPA: DUF2007 domain-containing protein [Paludibaculum sp.]
MPFHHEKPDLQLPASGVSGNDLCAPDIASLPEGDEWVLFGAFAVQSDAILLRGFLESEGIPCLQPDENAARMGGEVTTSWAPFRLLVPASHLARASELRNAPPCDDAIVDEAEQQDEQARRAAHDRTAE